MRKSYFSSHVLRAITDYLIHRCLANVLIHPFNLQASSDTSPPKLGPKTACPCCILTLAFLHVVEREKRNSFCDEVIMLFRRKLKGKAQTMKVLAIWAKCCEDTDEGRFPCVCGWGAKGGPGKYIWRKWH